MAKIDFKKRVVRNIIIENRRQGKTDQEIYNELATRFDDKKALLKIIVGTATDQNKTKFKWVAHCLTFLLIFNLMFIYFVKYNTNSLPVNVDGKFVFLCFFTMGLIYQIYQFTLGEAFQILAGLWAINNGMEIIRIADTELYTSIVLMVIILGLLFLYSSKLFPKSRIFGYKKDDKGEFVL